MNFENTICSNCGSNKIIYDKERNKYICSDCNKEYDTLEQALISRTKIKNKRLVNSSKKVAVCGVFGGLALLLYLVEIFRLPMGFIFTAAPFLKLNISDVPIMIAGFCYGPITSAIIVVIKVLTKCLMTHTGFTGELADLFVSLSYILPATIIYRYKKTKSGALIGMGVGTIISTIVACLTNYFILLPMYRWKLSYTTTIFAGVLPFNLLKNILVSVLVFAIYKKISTVISKYGAK